MKKIAVVVYLVALHLLIGLLIWKGDFVNRASQRLGITAPPDAPIIETMREVHRQMDASVPAGASIFLGDSITMGLATAAVADHPVNYGIGYQRSDQLIESMRQYHSLSRAGRIYLTIGTNDILQGKTDGIRERYRTILAMIPANVPVVMSSPPMTRKGNAAPMRDAARAACGERTNCTFVDATRIGLDGLLPDGIHLNPVGYARWIALLNNPTRP